MSTVNIKQLESSVVPVRKSAGAVGYDLVSTEEVTIEVGQHVLVGTGIAMQLPYDMECQVRPRSGLAVKHGVTVLNSPGTIDSDYRGEVKVCLINHGHKPYTVMPGYRIAQAVFAEVELPTMRVVDDIAPTDRGQGGFGHSGGC
jgi:dUTP diphosphatase